MKDSINPHAEHEILDKICDLTASAKQELYKTTKLFQCEAQVGFLYRMLQAQRMVGKYYMTGHCETHPVSVVYFYAVDETAVLSYVCVDKDSIAHCRMTLEDLALSASDFLPCSEITWIAVRDRMLTRYPLQ